MQHIGSYESKQQYLISPFIESEIGKKKLRIKQKKNRKLQQTQKKSFSFAQMKSKLHVYNLHCVICPNKDITFYGL